MYGAGSDAGAMTTTVKSIVNKPTAYEFITTDRGYASILVLKEPAPDENHLPILVIGKHLADEFAVECVFKVPAEVAKLGQLTPLQILREMAARFGVPIQLGECIDTFFTRETLPMPASGNILDALRITTGEDFVLGAVADPFEVYGERRVEFRLLFGLRLNAYLRAIGA